MRSACRGWISNNDGCPSRLSRVGALPVPGRTGPRFAVVKQFTVRAVVAGPPLRSSPRRRTAVAYHAGTRRRPPTPSTTQRREAEAVRSAQPGGTGTACSTRATRRTRWRSPLGPWPRRQDGPATGCAASSGQGLRPHALPSPVLRDGGVVAQELLRAAPETRRGPGGSGAGEEEDRLDGSLGQEHHGGTAADQVPELVGEDGGALCSSPRRARSGRRGTTILEAQHGHGGRGARPRGACVRRTRARRVPRAAQSGRGSRGRDARDDHHAGTRGAARKAPVARGRAAGAETARDHGRPRGGVPWRRQSNGNLGSRETPARGRAPSSTGATGVSAVWSKVTRPAPGPAGAIYAPGGAAVCSGGALRRPPLEGDLTVRVAGGAARTQRASHHTAGHDERWLCREVR
jgi:hypothetical protein